MPGKSGDVILELGAATSAESGTEHAGVDDERHESSAAANASSSPAERSSINSDSMDARLGAERTSAGVRSRASSMVPWGTSSPWFAALLISVGCANTTSAVAACAATPEHAVPNGLVADGRGTHTVFVDGVKAMKAVQMTTIDEGTFCDRCQRAGDGDRRTVGPH